MGHVLVFIPSIQENLLNIFFSFDGKIMYYFEVDQGFVVRMLKKTLPVLIKEVLQKESGCRLCYMYSRCTCMELFQRLVAPLVFKIGIHQGQAGRKGVRGGEEEGWSVG
jgi:hypothetical protein